MEWLYSLDLIDRGTLPFSFLHRIEIWHYASNLVFERPLFGWGLDSSRSIADKVVLERKRLRIPRACRSIRTTPSFRSGWNWGWSVSDSGSRSA